ncbi:hypothetical protein SteCoe_12562 [Stentor coeruleus]|uniref:GDP-D-glucose phosphorylase 1 n=1 Tax=Stentor coeruleus TaxID=5963 RepID=A0A1R2CAF9_9CILI|nr:hypothetical protein SteCoe_12562 [Stentor coeruleus]
MSGVLDQSLHELWNNTYQEHQGMFNIKIEETHHREINTFHILYNPTGPHSASPISNTTFSNFDDSQVKFTEDYQVICWVDFDNEVISQEKPSEEAKEICDKEVTDSYHPLYINPTPWVRGQCFLSLFPEECLPQVASTELLTLAMSIFRLSQNPTLRLGYDSLGANSDINHLHFNILFSETFGGFPVEKAHRKLLKQSSLQHKNPDEINMFNIGVGLYELDFPAKCLLICPINEINDENMSDGIESVGNVTGMVLNNLIENNIPHSIMVAGNKIEVYVFPRVFQEEFSIGKASFLDLSGIVCTHKEEFFNDADVEQCRNYLAGLSADDNTWGKTKGYIIQLLEKLYN